MSLNFTLAVVPAVLTFLLHHFGRPLRRLRWVGLLVVAVMLPNAPYVVTDLIHVPEMVHWAPSRAAVFAGVLPLTAALVTSGVLSYAYCLHIFRRELRMRGWNRPERLAASAVVDVSCAIGVALGRISRLNSWDVLRPYRFAQGLHLVLLDPRSLILSLVIVVGAGFGVDWVASGAAHTVRDRIIRPHRQLPMRSH